jgi:hypothetical protein
LNAKKTLTLVLRRIEKKSVLKKNGHTRPSDGKKRAEVRNAHTDVRMEEAPGDLPLGVVVDRAPVLVCRM